MARAWLAERSEMDDQLLTRRAPERMLLRT